MMKPLMIVSLFLFSLQAFCAGESSTIQANGGAPAAQNFEAKYGVYQGNKDADRLLKIPEVQKLYQECVTEKPNDISDCLWNDKLSKAENKATLDKVQEELDKMNNISETVKADDKLKYEGRNLSNLKFNGVASDPTKSNDSGSSPAKKLEDYLFKKFTEAFYGNDPQKKKMMMDHNVFYNLYQSQLGKNLISTISAYALDSELIINSADQQKSVCLYGQESDLKRIREKNMKALSTINGSSPEAYQSWSVCLKNIQNLCSGEDGFYSPVTKAKIKVIYPSITDDDEIDRIKDARIKVSKEKACSAYRYIKDVRQALIETEKLEKLANEKLKDGIKDGLNPLGEVESYDVNKNEELLTVTSQEVVTTSEMDKDYQSKKEALEKCSQDYEGNKAECDKFLSGSEDDKNKLITEYALRSKMQSKNLDEDLSKENDPDKKNLERYLKEEGRTDAQIKEILARQEIELDKVRESIKLKYKEEREKLITNLGNELSKRVSLKDPQATTSQFANIKAEFDERPEYLKQVVFFNNVVSSFLSICPANEDCSKDTSKGSKNTMALEKELKSGAFVTENRGPASGNGNAQASVVDIEAIKQIAPKNSSDTKPTGSTGSNLSVDQINDMIITLPSDSTAPSP